jgi:hypothetical protein
MTELTSVEKLRLHVERLISSNVNTVELSVSFLNDVLNEITDISESAGESVDTEVVFSGGKFQE